MERRYYIEEQEIKENMTKSYTSLGYIEILVSSSSWVLSRGGVSRKKDLEGRTQVSRRIRNFG